eukprot:SAG22_NODE_7549_length_729_cov_1.400000_1_plen_76_part_00
MGQTAATDSSRAGLLPHASVGVAPAGRTDFARRIITLAARKLALTPPHFWERAFRTATAGCQSFTWESAIFDFWP